MGRGRRKRDAKRRIRMTNRNTIRKKMGKKIFFTLTHCHKKLSGVSNRYNYKANMHALCFVDARFYNVKYQASIMTDCNFRGSELIGVDLYNCNLRGSSFKNANLENVVFYNCNLRNADFTGTRFMNVTFICNKIDGAKNLNVHQDGITILRTYPKIEIADDLECLLLESANKESIFDAKVIHVNKGKLNKWNLSIIQSRCGDEGLDSLGKILQRKEKWERLFTVYSYISLIENWGSK